MAQMPKFSVGDEVLIDRYRKPVYRGRVERISTWDQRLGKSGSKDTCYFVLSPDVGADLENGLWLDESILHPIEDLEVLNVSHRRQP
jgi:hypothetical protein